MDVIYPDAGLLWMLHRISLDSPGLTFHIFNNDFLPGTGTQLSDLNAADTYFPPKVVADALFTSETINAHVGAIQAPNQSWTNTTGVPQTVYGYFVTDGTGTILVQAARFDNAPLVIPNGGVVLVSPILGGYSGLQS